MRTPSARPSSMCGVGSPFGHDVICLALPRIMFGFFSRHRFIGIDAILIINVELQPPLVKIQLHTNQERGASQVDLCRTP